MDHKHIHLEADELRCQLREAIRRPSEYRISRKMFCPSI
jgi:hypothetical protein